MEMKSTHRLEILSAGREKDAYWDCGAALWNRSESRDRLRKDDPPTRITDDASGHAAACGTFDEHLCTSWRETWRCCTYVGEVLLLRRVGDSQIQSATWLCYRNVPKAAHFKEDKRRDPHVVEGHAPRASWISTSRDSQIRPDSKSIEVPRSTVVVG